MKLKNFLIVVSDIEQSKKFYGDIFGLKPVLDFDGNVVMTEGLALQDRKIWEKLIDQDVVCGNADAELYFEENDMDGFLQRLEAYPEEIRYLNRLKEHDWGQRVVRIYDPDGHVIEVGESMDFVARRFYQSGMSAEDVAKKTQMPPEHVRYVCEGMNICLHNIQTMDVIETNEEEGI